jgi:hypothetical protein
MSTEAQDQFFTSTLFPPLKQFQGKESYFENEPPLSLAVGYIVVLGFGVFFSVVTMTIMTLSQRFGNAGDITSEHFK